MGVLSAIDRYTSQPSLIRTAISYPISPPDSNAFRTTRTKKCKLNRDANRYRGISYYQTIEIIELLGSLQMRKIHKEADDYKN